jgi:hypothetical protein
VSAALALLLSIGAAYLAAHVAFDWLARRFLVVSGAEYLLLGILLGPQVADLLNVTVLESLAPVMTLALGWIGVIVGTRFRINRLVDVPACRFRIGLAESALTFAIVAGLEFVAVRWVLTGSERDAVVAAVALASIAVASSDVGMSIISRVLGRRGAVADQLETSASLNAFVAVVAFGLLVSVAHGPVAPQRSPTATEWAVISIAIGIVGGILFHVFLGETPSTDRLFIALVGGIVMVSGAATYLRLSPLLAAMLFGILLVNTTSDPERLIGTLERVERPFYFVLLLFGGAAWQPSQYAWALPVLLYVAARALAKVGGARMSTRMNGALGELGPHWGRALLGQGRVALALGLTYLHQEDAPYRNIVFSAVVGSILVTEFLSARLVRSAVQGRVLAAGESEEAMLDSVLPSAQPVRRV